MFELGINFTGADAESARPVAKALEIQIADAVHGHLHARVEVELTRLEAFDAAREISLRPEGEDQ